jgi:hypothetical protein
MTQGVYREIAIETNLVAQILMVMLQSIGRDRENPRPDAEPRVNGILLAPVIADLLRVRMMSGRLPSALEPFGIERPELNGASTVASDSSH